MNDLPASVRAQADRIASGKGREPTFAHPMCTCSDARQRINCPVHNPPAEETT